jgi:hypothetical protein
MQRLKFNETVVHPMLREILRSHFPSTLTTARKSGSIFFAWDPSLSRRCFRYPEQGFV